MPSVSTLPWFQHSPRDLANVNEWKIMFDPYIVGSRLAQGHNRMRLVESDAEPLCRCAPLKSRPKDRSLGLIERPLVKLVYKCYKATFTQQQTDQKLICEENGAAI